MANIYIYILLHIIFLASVFTNEATSSQPIDEFYTAKIDDEFRIITPNRRRREVEPPSKPKHVGEEELMSKDEPTRPELALDAYSIENQPMIDSTAKFDDFARQSLRKVLFPYSEEFKYVSHALQSITKNVSLNYYDQEIQSCRYVRGENLLATFDNCRLDVYEKKFERNNTYVCSGEKCVVKFSFKSVIGSKTTEAWKIGMKIVPSVKGGIEIPLLAKVELGLGLEVSGEYGEAYEKSTSTENLVETSVDLMKNQIGIPAVVVAGVKCEIILRLVDSRFSYLYNMRESKPLIPCDKQTFRWGTNMPLFNEKEVIIPLYDDNGELLKIKYVHIHNIFGNK